MTTPASIIIEFGEGVDSGALALAELDGTLNLDAEGNEKTQFAPGDLVNFLVHHEPSIRIGSVRCSSGQVTDRGMVTRQRVADEVLFSGGNKTSELAYIISGAAAAAWYDTVAAKTGVPRARGTDTTLPTLGRTGRIVTAVGGVLPALAKLTMQVQFRAFRFTPPDLTGLAAGETWPVRIVVRMEAAT